MKKRVVVTGLGCITPLGVGKENYWDALLSGVSGVSHITRFDAEDYTSKIAAEVKNFTPEDYIDKKESRRMDRFTQFAVAATRMAIEDGNLDLDNVAQERFGAILGSGVGGIETLENEHTKLTTKGPRRVSPLFIPMMISNIAPGYISMIFGAKGPTATITTACASATHAIGEAFKAIQRGDADIMITGGSEAAITPISMAGFCSMKALSTNNDNPQKASRPFDKERDGFIMGEGAGIILIESLEHAEKRGATIYAELVGYGATSDAYHITAPDPEANGAAKSMEIAIKDAGINYNEIDYINAHGTSTHLNDKLETLAIKKVFKEYAKQLVVSSTKSMTGHLLGASGGIEAIASVLAVKNDKIPPTINYENPDPECDLDYAPNKYREKKVNYALSNSLGFGGHNGTVIFKKF